MILTLFLVALGFVGFLVVSAFAKEINNSFERYGNQIRKLQELNEGLIQEKIAAQAKIESLQSLLARIDAPVVGRVESPIDLALDFIEYVTGDPTPQFDFPFLRGSENDSLFASQDGIQRQVDRCNSNNPPGTRTKIFFLRQNYRPHG
jgi:hypothetical protein